MSPISRLCQTQRLRNTSGEARSLTIVRDGYWSTIPNIATGWICSKPPMPCAKRSGWGLTAPIIWCRANLCLPFLICLTPKLLTMNMTLRPCPICRDSSVAAEPFLANSVRQDVVTASTFASRKVPEYMSHAMVRCTGCDLVFVDRPPSQQELADSYHAADYDSAEEAEHAADSYAKAIRPVLA